MSTEPTLSTSTATQRLVESRNFLRQAMQGPPNVRLPLDARKPTPEWLINLKSIPIVTVLVEAVSSWWMQHPLRVASLVAIDTAHALAQPLARRNPVGLALAALALGGLLVWARPWRWILKPAMFAGLWTQLLSKGIAHLPLESWLSAPGSVALKMPSVQPTTPDKQPAM